MPPAAMPYLPAVVAAGPYLSLKVSGIADGIIIGCPIIIRGDAEAAIDIWLTAWMRVVTWVPS